MIGTWASTKDLRSRLPLGQPSARKDVVGTAQLQYVRLRLLRTALKPTEGRHRILQAVEEIRILAGVGVAGGFLYLGNFGDVHIVRGCGELCRILAVGHFVVVQRKAALQLLPCLEREIRNSAVVGMVVDRPVGEYGIWIFLLDQ